MVRLIGATRHPDRERLTVKLQVYLCFVSLPSPSHAIICIGYGYFDLGVLANRCSMPYYVLVLLCGLCDLWNISERDDSEKVDRLSII